MKTSSARWEGDVEREESDSRPRRRHGKKHRSRATREVGRVISLGRIFLMLAAVGLFFGAAGWAQEVKVVEGTAVAAPATATPAAATPQPKPGGKPADAAKAAEAAKKAAEAAAGGAKKDGQPDAAKPGEQKTGEPAVTQRPTKPPKEPDPKELKVEPDPDGKIRFSFNGQPWPAVLEWLAGISNMSLDWQELPGDFLNLTTQQPYTVEEARGLINRHLLARGFTMLQHGEVLSIVNIKKLDPGLVPRVMPEDLEKRHPYEFVKVSFPLQWMMADTAAEELKPMISPNGKLNALKSINRLEAIDAVINLRELHKLIKEEQSANGQERLVREFVLQHARAIDVQTQLNDLLGIEEKKGKAPMTPEQMQMQQQQAMMRAQQQQQQGQQPQAQKDKPPINLVINSRKNSIVANAPPDKMAIIEQAVRVLDVPKDGAEELLANVNRMQVYRLAAVDPDALMETLNDLGVLHPTTRLQVDKRNKSIIAYAPVMDHLTIRALVNKLDGSGRKFEVIQLRRLEADHVAGSIDFMMGGADKEKNQQRRPFYYDFGYYGGGRQQEETSNDKFRVDADVENNRLLLWANPIELEEVMNLLAKLGEVPARGSNTNTVRVLQLEPGKASDDALERIRRAWPSLSPNPLVVPPADQSSDAVPRRDRTKDVESPARSPSIKSIDTRSRETRAVPKAQSPIAEQGEAVAVVAAPAVLRRIKDDDIALAQSADQGGGGAIPTPATKDTENPVEPPIIRRDDKAANGAGDLAEPAVPAKAADEGGATDADRQRLRRQIEDALKAEGRGKSNANVPIVVNRGPNGELVVSSPDTEALDLFEEMINEMGPPRKDYQVFYLKHGFAFWVAARLEDYFEVEDDSKKNDRGYPFYYFGDYGSSSQKSDTRRLSRRRPLKFITDTDTNTILVTGADPNQLKVIEQLIEIYDRPEPMDSRAARMTKTFQLKYSKAKVVGDTVKDVYRDLLSSNDKALQQQQGGDQKNKRPESQNTYITNFGGGEDEGKPTEVRFKGKLSIGTDELSNTLVVSTEGENLMNNVERLIESLDQAARPSLSTVRVLQTRGSMDSKDVRKALTRALIDQQLQKQQQQQRLGQQQQGQQPQQQQAQQQQVDENGALVEQ